VGIFPGVEKRQRDFESRTFRNKHVGFSKIISGDGRAMPQALPPEA